MTCAQCQEWLPRLPGDPANGLTPAERAAIERHLATCADCRAETEWYQQDRLVLQAAAPYPALPNGFWERASARLDRVPSSRSHSPLRWPRLLIIAVALVATTALVFLGRARRPALGNPALLYRSAALHGFTPDYATADPNAAQSWLSQRVAPTMPVLNLSLAGGDLIGAAIASGPQPALYYRTRAGMAVLAESARADLPAGPWRLVTVDRYRFRVSQMGPVRAATWTAQGHRYALIARDSLESLLNLALVASKHCQSADVGP